LKEREILKESLPGITCNLVELNHKIYIEVRIEKGLKDKVVPDG
jgi:hypothetical protein